MARLAGAAWSRGARPRRGRRAGPSPVRPVTGAAMSDRQTVVTHPSGPIVILGASYAAGWHPSVPASRSSTAGRRPAVVSTARAIRARRRAAAPRAVIVWGFINDVFRAPPASIDASIQRERDTSPARRGWRRHGIEPILTTEVSIRGPEHVVRDVRQLGGLDDGERAVSGRHQPAVRETNVWLRVSGRASACCCSISRVWWRTKPVSVVVEFATEDGSHIPDAGYAALAAYACPCWRALPQRRYATPWGNGSRPCSRPR